MLKTLQQPRPLWIFTLRRLFLIFDTPDLRANITGVYNIERHLCFIHRFLAFGFLRVREPNDLFVLCSMDRLYLGIFLLATLACSGREASVSVAGRSFGRYPDAWTHHTSTRRKCPEGKRENDTPPLSFFLIRISSGFLFGNLARSLAFNAFLRALRDKTAFRHVGRRARGDVRSTDYEITTILV